MILVSGARCFILVSLIKINGEHLPPGHPFKADNILASGNPDGVSKREA